MTMQHDGGGGSSVPPVTSNVTVDPGEIRAFARFLQDMETELSTTRDSLADNVGEAERTFGKYDGAETAVRKHDTTLQAELDALDALITRFSELTEGTIQVSRKYTDLEELNRTNADVISAHLTADGGDQ
ncbi:MAG TPA: hypothetical protein IAA98_04665 [Candidatus Avipropionibacterium avicola]|uniref:Uncharacterized protein n=1 Tax=Candidatus Avipropionibacterium avicola TaxID=2840701 RepID=A0A9D1GW52_9ACTN|nr:hypothetical protein [Candidatus Avipropionibacterium avicola]